MGYVLFAAGIFLLDFGLKEFMDRTFGEKEERPALGGRVLLRKFHNRGAMLGIFQSRQRLLTLGSGMLVLGAALGWLVLLFRRGYGFLKTGLTFLVGGAACNLYDRIVRGHVIDYFSFNVRWRWLRRIVFNLSDLFIFLGSAMLVLCSFLKRK